MGGDLRFGWFVSAGRVLGCEDRWAVWFGVTGLLAGCVCFVFVKGAMKSFDRELVSGNLTRSVWKLMWPVVLTQLAAGVHGFIDQVMVGHYIDGIEANAGIGAAWQVFLVFIVFLSSLFHGMAILTARYAGKRDHESVNKVAYDVFITAVYLLVFVVGPLGYWISPYLLDLVNTAPEVKAHALPYIRFLFMASVPMFMMFLLNGAFLSTGNPKIPVVLNVLTAVTHVLLSWLFITGAGPFPEMGSLGAAVGTCAGPIPSVLLALYLILRHKVILGPPKRFSCVPDWGVIKSVTRLGVPAGTQAVLLNIGGVALYAFIGGLPNSAEAQAAYTICYGQLFSFVTWTGFGVRAASATLIGQNIGAGKTERGIRAVYLSALFGFVWASSFGVLYWFFPDTLLGFFNVKDGETLIIGTSLLHYLTFSGIFVIVSLALTGGLQGAGDTVSPMLIAFATQIVILLGICEVYRQSGNLTTDVIWAAILVSHVCRFGLSLVVFRRGRWKGLRVSIDEPDEPELDPYVEAAPDSEGSG